jgi:hypothetical protein
MATSGLRRSRYSSSETISPMGPIMRPPSDTPGRSRILGPD